jgi:signal transduction histidine kinase
VNQITPRYSLHSRITLILLVVAIVSTTAYLTVMVLTINRLEESMMATLVGHELDELVTSLAEDPQTKMPRTASVNAYLRSRDQMDPVPQYLARLSPNAYKEIRVGNDTYQVMVLDFMDDRIYVSFSTTEISKHRSKFQALLVGGGLFSTLVLVVSGFWLFRRYLLPVSKLADEVAGIDPNDRLFRIGDRYRGYEVELIVRSIDQFLDRLDEYIEREQSFTAAASHELRTPLSVITTAIDLLEQRGVSDEQKRIVDRMKESSRDMGNVIEALLLFARNPHETVAKTLPEVKLHRKLLSILKKYEKSASIKKLALQFKCKARLNVRISETHLEIVVGNLVRNAIANTNAGEVKVTLFKNGFSVKDTGHGIEAHEIELVVERNYHGSDSTGAGIGLYLVKQICDMYGLDLAIESTPGKGSEFIVTIPENLIN